MNWVNVTDRLPPTENYVLVVHTNALNPRDLAIDRIRFANFTAQDGWRTPRHLTINVTHWLSIPPSLKDEP